MIADEPIEVIITALDRDWLVDLCHQLVDARLAASAHVVHPITSIYRCQGDIHTTTEARSSTSSSPTLSSAIRTTSRTSRPFPWSAGTPTISPGSLARRRAARSPRPDAPPDPGCSCSCLGPRGAKVVSATSEPALHTHHGRAESGGLGCDAHRRGCRASVARLHRIDRSVDSDRLDGVCRQAGRTRPVSRSARTSPGSGPRRARRAEVLAGVRAPASHDGSGSWGDLPHVLKAASGHGLVARRASRTARSAPWRYQP